MWFSVDVETTGTNPWNPKHHLATVGAVAIFEDGLIADSWYERLTYRDEWDEGTQEWWLEQNAAAKAEMFTTTGRTRPKVAARSFVVWVAELTDNAVFVANPSTFDHAWIARWLTQAGEDLPFSHRTLCLRSVAWGRHGGAWGGPIRAHTSLVPHHALHDAQAQALDLLDFLVATP